jgi:hypothetical protein
MFFFSGGSTISRVSRAAACFSSGQNVCHALLECPQLLLRFLWRLLGMAQRFHRTAHIWTCGALILIDGTAFL